MSNILSSEDFGRKLYNRFPPSYREDDAKVDYALSRYLEAMSDGGFKYAIDEINGITHTIDPNRATSKVLPVLFKQYGLEIFNGIPENYLRYLLPKLGEAWSKKGSLSVVEFITASLTGIKTSSFIEYDGDENPTVGVRMEMDYNIGDYFPEAGQFSRLLKNFVPFYCDLNLIYSYLFYEIVSVSNKEEGFADIVKYAPEEYKVKLDTEDKEIFNVSDKDADSVSLTAPSSNSLTNRFNSTLNGSLYLNAVHSYDTIKWRNGNTEIVF